MSQRIKLDLIVFDAGTQIREAISEPVVSEYAERMTEGVVFPAIVLFHDGNHYYLADGFHRALAAKRNDFSDISAEIRPGTKADALWFALGANKANGHRMTVADKKHAVLLALRTWPDKSMHQIADQIGCSYNYVQQEKPKVVSAYQLPDRVTGKDGKSYPASRSKREKTMPEVQEQPKFQSRAAVQQRRERMRQMAADGHTTRQIAAEIGVDDRELRRTLRNLGVEVPADEVVGRSHRHDANRILENIVMDAENLTADEALIDLSALDRARLGDWIASLNRSKSALAGFIRQLIKEHQKHEAA